MSRFSCIQIAKFFSVVFVVALISVSAVSAQEQAESSSAEKNYSLAFSFGPMVMLNTDDYTKSAPSPIFTKFGFGADIYFARSLFFQPELSFFLNYYLYDGDNAQPAEIENRTATALSFMLNLGAGKDWTYGLHSIQVSGGLGLLFRTAFLSAGVNESDPGYTDQTTASEDLSSINSWFWSDLNFLYPHAAVTYIYKLSERWQVGAEFRMYFPLGSLINEGSVDGMLYSINLKLLF